jgi:ABC-type transport system substrate-binding protein
VNRLFVSLWIAIACEAGLLAEHPTPKPGSTLRLALPTDIRSLDPAIAYEPESWPLVRVLYHGLLDYGEGFQLVPWQASAWEISPDGKTYTFKLRTGVRFSNGREVVAQDYVYTLERILNPKTQSPGDGFFRGIAGAREFQAGHSDHVSGLSAPASDTFVIKLEQADFSFRYVLAMPFAFAVPRETVEKHGDQFGTHPDGTGPFVLAEWKRGSELRFKRSPTFDRPESVSLQGIEIMVGGDETLHLMMFEHGELDVANVTPVGIPIPDYPRIKRTPHLRRCVEEMPHVATWYVALNTELKPFDDARVRQAMNYAVDRARLLSLVNGRGVPAKGVLPPLMPGFNPRSEGYGYDPTKARSLLEEAGYRGGFNTTLWMRAGDLMVSRVGEAIQHDLGKIGVGIELKKVALAVFLDARSQRRNIPCSLEQWYQDYPDPSNFLSSLLDGRRIVEANGVNIAFYNNPAVNELLDQGAADLDAATRLNFYQRAEELVVKDAPWIFLFHPTMCRMMQPWVRGSELHPIWPFRFERMRIER